MLVRLARHACAGSRDQWDGPDADRPLDANGLEQAVALADALAGGRQGRLLASPTRRCLDTLVPLASQWSAPIEPEPALAADVPADRVLTLVASSAEGDVLCSHGEVMGSLLERFRSDGVDIPADPGDDALLLKGTVWELDVREGTVVSLRHVAPAASRPCAHLAAEMQAQA